MNKQKKVTPDAVDNYGTVRKMYGVTDTPGDCTLCKEFGRMKQKIVDLARACAIDESCMFNVLAIYTITVAKAIPRNEIKSTDYDAYMEKYHSCAHRYVRANKANFLEALQKASGNCDHLK